MRAPVADHHKVNHLLMALCNLVEERLDLDLTVEGQVLLEKRFLDALQDPQLSIVDLTGKKRRY